MGVGLDSNDFLINEVFGGSRLYMRAVWLGRRHWIPIWAVGQKNSVAPEVRLSVDISLLGTSAVEQWAPGQVTTIGADAAGHGVSTT